jgi:hypothetical protein
VSSLRSRTSLCQFAPSALPLRHTLLGTVRAHGRYHH